MPEQPRWRRRKPSRPRYKEPKPLYRLEQLLLRKSRAFQLPAGTENHPLMPKLSMPGPAALRAKLVGGQLFTPQLVRVAVEGRLLRYNFGILNRNLLRHAKNALSPAGARPPARVTLEVTAKGKLRVLGSQPKPPRNPSRYSPRVTLRIATDKNPSRYWIANMFAGEGREGNKPTTIGKDGLANLLFASFLWNMRS